VAQHEEHARAGVQSVQSSVQTPNAFSRHRIVRGSYSDLYGLTESYKAAKSPLSDLISRYTDCNSYDEAVKCLDVAERWAAPNDRKKRLLREVLHVMGRSERACQHPPNEAAVPVE
jgi:hypothetical protein